LIERQSERGAMMQTMKNKQRGIGFASLFLILAAVISAAIFGMRLIPAYMNNAKIESVFQAIASDPEMQNATVKDIRMSYNKRSSVDSIDNVLADDVQVDKEDGRLVLSASYTVKLPLAGNISLVLEFNPSSAK
jgi:hypothetical protein